MTLTSHSHLAVSCTKFATRKGKLDFCSLTGVYIEELNLENHLILDLL